MKRKKIRVSVTYPRFETTCRSCGYSWKPEIKKWSRRGSVGFKVIHCPMCGSTSWGRKTGVTGD